MTWDDAERHLRTLSIPEIVGVAVRFAQPHLPAIEALGEKYGAEVAEWFEATRLCVRLAAKFSVGGPVTRFQLLLAAEGARLAAASTAEAARQFGPSPLIEPAEFAYAAAAFAADAARATTPEKAARTALLSLRSSAAGGPVPDDLVPQ